MRIAKLLAVLLVLAIAGQQLVMYYEIVIAGTFRFTAAFHQLVITGLIWPVAVVAVAFALIRAIITFKLPQQ